MWAMSRAEGLNGEENPVVAGDTSRTAEGVASTGGLHELSGLVGLRKRLANRHGVHTDVLEDQPSQDKGSDHGQKKRNDEHDSLLY